MKTLYSSIIAIFALAGCMSNNAQTTSQQNNQTVAEAKTSTSVNINKGDQWRMTCNGGSGAMQVPIFARVKRVSKSTGKVDLVVTDRDGYEGDASATVLQNTITMFGKRTTWSSDGRAAKLNVPDICPRGMLIERL